MRNRQMSEREQSIPDVWERGIIAPSHKKGDVKNANQMHYFIFNCIYNVRIGYKKKIRKRNRGAENTP